MFHVRVADDALESMALAAIEAYALGDGRAKPQDRLETLGYIWGYSKVEDDKTTIQVTKIAVSIAAERTRNSVLPHPDAGRLKREFVSRWSPQLTMLGDFHTHPYRDLSEVRKHTGFEFSPGDFVAFDGDDLAWEASGDKPLMFAMAICRLKRVREGWYEQVRDNVCSFSVGEFRFWLNAAVGYIDPNGTRQHTGNKRSDVFLDLGSRFFNLGGDRISNGH